MTVQELIVRLQELVDGGKGEYNVTCEGFCVGIDGDIDIYDEGKTISLA